ncbi:tetratricopeptide repeat protein 36 [Macrosteles quadrilineatus]|uniref:tetratricopeptide repeat protein 36 n=1 Tax=Macrosteles quadrilineatus TaxID=74068 RepID=UPI0023E2010A|nr:tetratricopeptide repeat protein 36 [Macrosteles quadrilineatus]XP_054288445.1 tetratricopeptide repeat protein 36 [Macrosteles quadrilineatus]
MSTRHDKAILDAIFNPYLPLGEGTVLQQECNLKDESNETEGLVTQEELEAKTLEAEAVRKAESGILTEAVEMFSLALKLAPGRASIYNNRAQAYRLLGDDTAALQDLNRAIELSCGQGEVARLALCQRALLHRRQGNNTSAGADLRAAAALGSDFAKQLLVQMNPYAAMCNQMLKQMFTKQNQRVGLNQ